MNIAVMVFWVIIIVIPIVGGINNIITKKKKEVIRAKQAIIDNARKEDKAKQWLVNAKLGNIIEVKVLIKLQLLEHCYYKSPLYGGMIYITNGRIIFIIKDVSYIIRLIDILELRLQKNGVYILGCKFKGEVYNFDNNQLVYNILSFCIDK